MLAHGYDIYGTADELLDTFDILPGRCLQILVCTYTRSGALPAGYFFINRLASFEGGDAGGNVIYRFAVQFIAGAYF